jgi:hypothetical protein
LGELIFGAVRSGAAMESHNRSLISGLRSQFPTLPFDEPAAEVRRGAKAVDERVRAAWLEH